MSVIVEGVNQESLDQHRSEEQIMEEHFYTDNKYMKESKMKALCYELFARTTVKKVTALEKKLDEVHKKGEKLSLEEYGKLYQVIMVDSFIKFIYNANRNLKVDDAKHFQDKQMFNLYLYSESKNIIDNVRNRKERELTKEENDILVNMTQEFARTGVLPKFTYGNPTNSYQSAKNNIL